MCTVSFLPLPDGGYLLGTNRDESPRRGQALAPAVAHLPLGDVLMPRDPDAGGTWVAVDQRGRCLCVLNGDRPAVPPPALAPSRGTLLLEMMACPSSTAIVEELHLRHVAGTLTQKPFKLMVAEPGEGAAPARALLVDWNGRDLPTQRSLVGPAVLVSSSFDPEGVARRREAAFADLRRVPVDDPEALRASQMRWHAGHSAEAPDGDTYSVCMHREEASTVSFTAVSVGAERVEMDYRPGAPCLDSGCSRVSFERLG